MLHITFEISFMVMGVSILILTMLSCVLWVCVRRGEVKIIQAYGQHFVCTCTHTYSSMASDIHVRMEMGRGKIVASASLSSNGNATEACISE